MRFLPNSWVSISSYFFLLFFLLKFLRWLQSNLKFKIEKLLLIKAVSLMRPYKIINENCTYSEKSVLLDWTPSSRSVSLVRFHVNVKRFKKVIWKVHILCTFILALSVYLRIFLCMYVCIYPSIYLLAIYIIT